MGTGNYHTGTARIYEDVGVLTCSPEICKDVASVFNALTGLRARVGNYPGVTVEKREGRWSQGNVDVQMRDLPGAYSLTSWSPEERIARDELLSGDYDVVVVVVDACPVVGDAVVS